MATPWMFNALGEVRCNVTVGAWIRPGTVSLPKGLWRRHGKRLYGERARPRLAHRHRRRRMLQRRARPGGTRNREEGPERPGYRLRVPGPVSGARHRSGSRTTWVSGL